METNNKYLSSLSVWGLSFGFAVGWGAFVISGSEFLPTAGPLGTVIGIFVGALAMAVIGWNYHRMVSSYPGPGGAYAYTQKATERTVASITAHQAHHCAIHHGAANPEALREGQAFVAEKMAILNSDRLVHDIVQMGFLTFALVIMFSLYAIHRRRGEALEALTAPDAPKFDFVLTDAWMPEMTGEELVAVIRDDPALAANRVYLFTADAEMKETYAENGFNGILLKPANLEALKGLLQ